MDWAFCGLGGVVSMEGEAEKSCSPQRARRKKGRLTGEVGEFGFFGDGGGAFEVEVVAVGVGEFGVPHGVAYERFVGFDAAGFEFVVEGDGIFALEPDGAAHAAFVCGDAAGIVFLEHQGRAA